jgi:peptidoglycan/xylan/chitin deacetylase (PgdA/CDA1 family)
VVRRVVEEGHELACHGMTHRPFPTLDLATARWEIEESARILRDFAPVASFRAPYLQLPREHLPILEETGFRLDSSQARYKLDHYRAATATTLRRVPASITSSALRLPPLVRDRWLDALRSPVVLFVHPWEFVDLTRERLRWDCRVRTGEPALASLRSAIAHLAARAARFVRMDELPPATR